MPCSCCSALHGVNLKIFLKKGKKIKSIQEEHRRNFKKYLGNGKVENNTNAKGKEKGKAASHYRPITCLSLVWKLLTGAIAEEINGFLDTNFLLPQEQKGFKRKSRGTNDLLFIDKVITRDVKMRNWNVSMAWIAYKKA